MQKLLISASEKSLTADLGRASTREAATRQILDLISQSREDAGPVFDAILHRAADLCGASAAALILGKAGDAQQRMPAHYGVDPATVAIYDRGEVSMDPDASSAARAILSGKVVHVEDQMDTEFYRQGVGLFVSIVRDSGIRTEMLVPLLVATGGIGAFVIFRKEVKPFSPDEVALAETFAAQAVIAIENVRQFRELQDSLEQQEATSDILRVISQSREDEAQVFDLVLEKAAVLCDADQGSLMIVNEARTHVRHMADWGHDRTAYRPGLEYSLDLPLSIVATIRTAKVVHIEDYSQSDAYKDRDPIAVNLVETEGHRTRLIVPLLQNGIAIGCIALSRRAVRPFTLPEIQLVETFAAQAVIAIENVRQFRELQSRLAREAASAEILAVISNSRDDDGPVFDAILRNAARLCRSPMAWLLLVDDARTMMTLAGYHGDNRRTLEIGDAWPLNSDPDTPTGLGRAMLEARTVQDEDMTLTPHYLQGEASMRQLVDEEGLRTRMSVPLLSGGRAIGAIVLSRREVAPFGPEDSALLDTFAEQAVIAIENARQFRELQSRLAREAATREILTVISQSRDDERPVFDVVLRKSADLCGASMANLEIISEDRSHAVMVAHWGETLRHYVVGETAWPMDSELAAAIYIGEGRIVHVHDLADTDLYRSGDPMRVADVDKEGIRTFLAVPLFSGGKTIGCIALYRREVNPYAADEIALVETFAAQAVIAIENVRQFRELQTRLEREAATREILEVISQSRDDERPVFDVVLRKAADLCHASMASLDIISEDRSHAVLVAHWGEHIADLIPAGTTVWPMDSDLAPPTCMRESRVVHVHDMADTDLYRSGDPMRVTAVDIEGIRTFLAVPLFSGSRTVGCIEVYRREVNPFTADEIFLVETFAAQAVIAIENVRQFRELQTRLEREKASAEILEVISQSRDDEGPVFDVILQNVARLCDTSLATFTRVNGLGTHLEYVAHWGMTLKTFDLGTDRWPLDGPLQVAQSVREGRVINTPDLIEDALYRQGDPTRVRLVDVEGVRSYLTVPLITTGREAIGCIALYRKELRPFTADEIALVETFAAQAVIAIENVRQFRELQTRLQREAATREILEVISQSRDDDRPVFDMVLRKAAQLCGASLADLCVISEDRSHAVVAAHWGEMEQQQISVGDPIGTTDSEAAIPTCMREGRIVVVDDLADTDLYRSGDPIRVTAVDKEGIRTFLAVPLLSGGRAVGCIAIYRLEVRPFTADQIALVETFAAQAVIAIENVRQFRELQTRLAREAATREILEVISRNPDDDRPVFDVILRNAIKLCAGDTSALLMGRKNDPRLTLAAWRDRTSATSVVDDTMITRTNATEMRMDPSVHVSAMAILEERNIHVLDMTQHPAYLSGEPSFVIMVETLGVRTALFVPLIGAQGGLGTVNVHRREVRPFAPDEIALVETFAAQAVIAIENVRQFRELQTRLAREAATREILEVISQSRDDDAPVFDVIAQRAAGLCGAAVCTFWRVEDGLIHYCASHGLDSVASAETRLTPSTPLMDSTLTGQVVKQRAVVRIEDATAESYYDHEWARRQGLRQLIGVPILIGEDVWGSINLMWPADRAPHDADIQLVETFSAQASIAIENVRQFRELQARLAREAATKNILRVISECPDDEQPTFEAILDSATQLCGTQYASIVLGRRGDASQRMVAHRAAMDETVALFHDGKVLMDPKDSIAARAILEGITIHVPDMADTDQYRAGHERFRLVVDHQGLRTNLFVPLLGPEGGIGCLILWKKEVAPFTADQIALMETFASHAVIAMENVRQFRELQTRLAREAATREILEVISQSRDDDKPVFDAILRKAAELCHAPMASLIIISEDRNHAVLAADWGHDEVSRAVRVGETLWVTDSDSAFSTCTREGRIVHIEDLADSDGYRSGQPMSTAVVDQEGLRTFLAVPLFSSGQTVGCILVYRQEVKPFAPDEIALVETFAAQAVIAIENVRQFRELQARLAREAATREILEVISRNPDDDRPVFDAILGNAIRLCGADTSALFLGRLDDQRLVLAAWRDRAASSSVMEDEMIAQTNATPMLMDPTVHVSAQAIIEECNIHIPDVQQHPSYLSSEPSYRIFGDALGIRSALVVPLIDARGALGVVQVHRREVRPFTDDEIALVETFAAQAVIAIENVRQFKALEALNAELGDRVQDQVGEIERMGRLKRFLPTAVADAVVSSGSEKMLSSHRALLGVLFCDIRGFTAFCETAEPEETIEVLQTYHEEMGALINAHGAGVDHRMGDGIMVLFNDPLPCDDPAGDAVRLAMAMRARMAELCAKWKRSGYRLGFGLGVSLGYATVGMVGAGGRHDYTASGTAINLASRLCDEAQDGEILISPRAWTAIEDDFTAESRGEIAFKGIREPVEVFCVTGVVG